MVFIDLCLTGTASIVANLFTHPLETIKVRQMVSGGSSLTVGYTLVKHEGWLALYKGINAALVRAVISGGGRLTGYDFLKQVAIQRNILSPQPTVSELPLRGAMAVTAACFAQYVAAPVDLVRTRQAMYKGPIADAPSILAVARKVVAQDGFRGLFAGSSALMGRAASFNIAQLLTYDECKYQAVLHLGLRPDSVVTHVVAASGAGLAATTASAPFENVKTYSQLHGKAPISHSIRSIYASAGIMGFFRGWTPLYLKIAPHSLIVFVTMEFLRNTYARYTNQEINRI